MLSTMWMCSSSYVMGLLLFPFPLGAFRCLQVIDVFGDDKWYNFCSLGILSWPHLRASWIMKKQGERMLVAKYLGSSIKQRFEDPFKILDYLMSSSFISWQKERTWKDFFCFQCSYEFYFFSLQWLPYFIMV